MFTKKQVLSPGALVLIAVHLVTCYDKLNLAEMSNNALIINEQFKSNVNLTVSPSIILFYKVLKTWFIFEVLDSYV